MKNHILTSFSPQNKIYDVSLYIILRKFTAIYEQIPKGDTFSLADGTFIAIVNNHNS